MGIIDRLRRKKRDTGDRGDQIADDLDQATEVADDHDSAPLDEADEQRPDRG